MVPANAKVSVRFLTLLVDIPCDFMAVEQVSIQDGNAIPMSTKDLPVSEK
jgi:hypothetical protein